MSNTNKWEILAKLGFSVTAAGLSLYFKAIAMPVVLLMAVMVADYGTGMTKAWMIGELSSRIGIRGIVKKLSYLVLVAVAVVVDWVIFGTMKALGVEAELSIFGLTVTVWLIINEVISILENLSGIGVPLPAFFSKAVSKLKLNMENSEDHEEEKR